MAKGVEMTGWVCSACGAQIRDPDSMPRVPCEACGASARTANVSVNEELHAEVHLKMHSKHRDGGPKVVREVISGDDYFRKGARWTYFFRLIDRANNWYEERFLDRETGKIIHQQAEPLTDHRRVARKSERHSKR